MFGFFEKIRQSRIRRQAEEEKRKEEEKKDQERRDKYCFSRRTFKNFFEFDPELLQESETRDPYRKEVLIRLAVLSLQVKESAREFKDDPDNEVEYVEVSTKYMEVIRAVAYFDPAFKNKIPHWSELPQFIDDLIGTKKRSWPSSVPRDRVVS